MKKIFTVIISLLLCFALSFCSFASKKTSKKDKTEKPAQEPSSQTEEEQDMSVPRLMVTDYKLSRESIKPGKNAYLEITFKNFSRTKTIKNIKLSLSCDEDISTVGMPTEYVGTIYAGGSYVWKTELSVSKTAQIGLHDLTVTSEYEDKYFASFSSSDVVTVSVKQSVGLDYSGITLPAKVVQGDTEVITMSFMNTGKTDIRNCKVVFDIESLSGGGAVFVGEIPAGESAVASCNLRVLSEKLGKVSGKATISYEDTFGKEYTSEQALETLIEEKVYIDELTVEDEDEKKYPLWWLFLLLGVVAGGGVGCAIPLGIYSKKQRKEDELRL